MEEKANQTYGEYKAALDVTADLESQMGSLKDEIAAMSKQLSEEQGNISVYTDRQAKALSIKGEAEVEVRGGDLCPDPGDHASLRLLQLRVTVKSHLCL